jgi:hypothetical protein
VDQASVRVSPISPLIMTIPPLLQTCQRSLVSGSTISHVGRSLVSRSTVSHVRRSLVSGSTVSHVRRSLVSRSTVSHVGRSTPELPVSTCRVNLAENTCHGRQCCQLATGDTYLSASSELT